MGREFADAILGTRQRNQDALEWEIVCWLHSGKVICACFDTVPVDLFRVAVAFPATLLAIACVASAALIGMPSFEFAAGDGVVHNVADVSRFPCLRLCKTTAMQRFCKNQGGAYLLICRLLHEAKHLTIKCVLRHKGGLLLLQLLGGFLRELKRVFAGTIDDHDFRPQLIEIGA